MKYLIVISCIIATTLAQPAKTGKSAKETPVEIANIYLGQDSVGNYKLYFKSKNITREEERKDDGSVLGSYIYKDLDGADHKVIYTSAANTGYIANSADIPKPVPEGEELIIARKNHLALVDAEVAKYPKGLPVEEPVTLDAVLAKLVVPELDTLPEEAVPAEDEENVEAKVALFAEYKRILGELTAAYKALLK